MTAGTATGSALATGGGSCPPASPGGGVPPSALPLPPLLFLFSSSVFQPWGPLVRWMPPSRPNGISCPVQSSSTTSHRLCATAFPS